MEEEVAKASSLEAPLHSEILKTIKAIPELLQPIDDLATLSKYRKEVDLLMSTLLPSTIIDSVVAGVIIPFQPVTIYASTKFKDLIRANEEGVWDFTKVNVQKGISELVAFCGMAILDKYYNFHMAHPGAMKRKDLDQQTGISTFYQAEINTMFAEVITLKEPK